MIGLTGLDIAHTALIDDLTQLASEHTHTYIYDTLLDEERENTMLHYTAETIAYSSYSDL
jgi:hypothetical protein